MTTTTAPAVNIPPETLRTPVNSVIQMAKKPLAAQSATAAPSAAEPILPGQRPGHACQRTTYRTLQTMPKTNIAG